MPPETYTSQPPPTRTLAANTMYMDLMDQLAEQEASWGLRKSAEGPLNRKQRRAQEAFLRQRVFMISGRKTRNTISRRYEA